MSVQAPLQGGTAALGAAVVKSLPAAGAKAGSFIARHAQETVLAVTSVAGGLVLLAKGARGMRLVAGDELSDGAGDT